MSLIRTSKYNYVISYMLPDQTRKVINMVNTILSFSIGIAVLKFDVVLYVEDMTIKYPLN